MVVLDQIDDLLTNDHSLLIQSQTDSPVQPALSKATTVVQAHFFIDAHGIPLRLLRSLRDAFVTVWSRGILSKQFPGMQFNNQSYF